MFYIFFYLIIISKWSLLLNGSCWFCTFLFLSQLFGNIAFKTKKIWIDLCFLHLTCKSNDYLLLEQRKLLSAGNLASFSKIPRLSPNVTAVFRVCKELGGSKVKVTLALYFCKHSFMRVKFQGLWQLPCSINYKGQISRSRLLFWIKSLFGINSLKGHIHGLWSSDLDTVWFRRARFKVKKKTFVYFKQLEFQRAWS